jgi:hypothetical protein
VISFPRVPEVEPGDPVTSTQLAGLADGLNARLVSGLGDGAWRVAYYYLALARQFRVMGQTDAEFFHSVQMLDEPLNLPFAGSIGGVSTSNPLGLYVHGQGTFPSEVDAYAVPMATVTDAEQAWELAKQQRGAFNPSTEEWSSPTFDAARHAFRIVYAGTSIYGNAYGGFQPTPEFLGDCLDPDASPNFEIYFTNVETEERQTFDGTCPDEPTHIAGIWQTPLAFWVTLNDGTMYYFDRAKWIEGPYESGAALRKTYSEHLPRVLNAFAGEFRGDTARVEGDNKGGPRWLGKAFDIASFLTRPYYLAPARGYTINDEVVPQYTQGSRSGSTVSGVIGSHFAQSGCWFSCAIVRVTGTIVPATVTFTSGDVVVGKATVGSQAGSALAMFTQGAEDIEVSVSSVSGASVTVSYELAETFAYRPGVHDLWTLLRLAGANSASDIDGSGRSIANANEIWEAYSTLGVIPKLGRDNELPPMEDRQIDTNAVFDKFRRLSRVVRCLHPSQVKGYAVVDGKSVLYVSPFYQSIVGLPECDVLKGIRDEIEHEAPKQGYTNEWCAFARFAAYHPSPTSGWSQEGYAEYWSTSDRCAFYASPLSSSELRRHFNANFPSAVDDFLAPEGATGYRYAKNLNDAAADEFYKSCRIYEPPLEIDSAETVTVDGETQVKITFKTRFHHHETAPASVDRDIGTWDLSALLTEAQNYRTDENAIREYLAWKDDTSLNCERTGPGNAADNSTVQGLPDNPYGSCFPHIWLVQLLPKPYDDGNDTASRSDTPIRHDVMLQAETYIRAMCEGYVDGQTSIDYGCTVGVTAVFDYTFANLCFDAFQGTSITTMPTAETDALGPDDVREDSPIGYGPLPTVRLAAETWNQFAKAVNKLTRVRVSLPFQFETQPWDETNDTRFVDAVRADGTAADCSSAGGRGWRSQFGGGGRSPATMSGSWAAATTMNASNTLGYSLGVGYVCSASGAGPLFQVENVTHEDEYRFELVDPDAIEAVPETWRDMLDTNAETLWRRNYQEQRERHTVVPYADGTVCNTIKGWDIDGVSAWQLEPYGPNTVTCEILPNTGRLTIPSIGTAVLYGAVYSGVECTQQIIVSDTYEPVLADELGVTATLILRVPFEDEVEE